MDTSLLTVAGTLQQIKKKSKLHITLTLKLSTEYNPPVARHSPQPDREPPSRHSLPPHLSYSHKRPVAIPLPNPFVWVSFPVVFFGTDGRFFIMAYTRAARRVFLEGFTTRLFARRFGDDLCAPNIDELLPFSLRINARARASNISEPPLAVLPASRSVLRLLCLPARSPAPCRLCGLFLLLGSLSSS